MFRITSKRSCHRITISIRTLSSSLQKGGPEAKFHPLPTFSEVGDTLVPAIQKAGTGHFVHVTGQYYDHDSALTRNVVMRVGENLETDEFEPELILDAALSHSEIKVLANILVDTKECRFLSSGEIDSVGSEDWEYGYVMQPCFSIFCRESLILKQHSKNRELTHLFSRPGFPLGQKLWMKDIENVFVNLSNRPWTQQTLGVRTMSDQLTLLQFNRELDIRGGEDTDVEPSYDELGEIMINTEWIVKLAAQLVYVASQNRFKNNSIPLFVPRVVQADLNPWIAMRNSLWQNSLMDELQRVQEDYVP